MAPRGGYIGTGAQRFGMYEQSTGLVMFDEESIGLIASAHVLDSEFQLIMSGVSTFCHRMSAPNRRFALRDSFSDVRQTRFANHANHPTESQAERHRYFRREGLLSISACSLLHSEPTRVVSTSSFTVLRFMTGIRLSIHPLLRFDHLLGISKVLAELGSLI